MGGATDFLLKASWQKLNQQQHQDLKGRNQRSTREELEIDSIGTRGELEKNREEAVPRQPGGIYLGVGVLLLKGGGGLLHEGLDVPPLQDLVILLGFPQLHADFRPPPPQLLGERGREQTDAQDTCLTMGGGQRRRNSR